jgi:hypothetical protein
MKILVQVKKIMYDQMLINFSFRKSLTFNPFDTMKLIFKNLIALKWWFKFYVEHDRGLVRSEVKSINSLVVCITFHFSFDRLKYLEEVTSSLDSLANNVKLIIITNTDDNSNLEVIRKFTKTRLFTISISSNLEHPFLLTQEHIKILRDQYKMHENISHFMYLEDDIFITRNNINYWLSAREDLKQFGLIPSFLRYEIPEGELELRSTDIPRTQSLKSLPKIKFSTQYWYINMKYPYQGMYLLDRELAQQYLFDDYRLDKRSEKWGVRERSASGLTFINIPKNFTSRNLGGFCINMFSVDPNALIHHIPNNYSNNPDTVYGKLEIKKMIY